MANVTFYGNRRVLVDLLQNHLLPHLHLPSDVLKLRRKDANGTPQDLSLAPLRQKFIDQYGAIGTCEEGTAPQILRDRVKKLLDIAGLSRETDFVPQSIDFNVGFAPKKQKPLSQGEFFSFDSNEIPQQMHYTALFSQLPFWKKPLAKYQFFRGDFHQATYAAMQKILNRQDVILKEFLDRELDPKYPLQDLRDRCLRIETFHLERRCFKNLLQRAHQTHSIFVKSLSFQEKCIFKIISFFHSFFRPGHTMEPPIIPSLACDLESFTHRKAVKFGTAEITHEGRKIPVQILAKFKLNNLSGLNNWKFSAKTVFHINRAEEKDTSYSLGHIAFSRNWRDQNEPWCYENSTHKIQGPLTDRRLDVGHLDMTDRIKQDSQTGDLPILRLLTQIAVEVLRLESDTRLEITSNYRDADAYCAGGFSDFYYRGQNRTDGILRYIRRERETGKLFPEYRDLTSFQVYLHKSPALQKSLGTEFTTTGPDEKERAALVDFELDAAPITWEAQIEKHPLLGNREGPILPKFFYRDLFAYEEKAPHVV